MAAKVLGAIRSFPLQCTRKLRSSNVFYSRRISNETVSSLCRRSPLFETRENRAINTLNVVQSGEMLRKTSGLSAASPRFRRLLMIAVPLTCYLPLECKQSERSRIL